MQGEKEKVFIMKWIKYAIRSMFAGAFLTFSTAAGAVGADLINKIAPGSGRFLFHSFLAQGWPDVFLNAELVTSNSVPNREAVFEENFMEKNG